MLCLSTPKSGRVKLEVSCRSCVTTAKKWTKLLFCLSKPIATLPFSLPSPSSLLKVTVVVVQKCWYNGNVTSHFSSLFVTHDIRHVNVHPDSRAFLYLVRSRCTGQRFCMNYYRSIIGDRAWYPFSFDTYNFNLISQGFNLSFLAWKIVLILLLKVYFSLIFN